MTQPPLPPDRREPPPGAIPGWDTGALGVPAPPPDDIAGYLRANAGRYTREGLTARLLQAGHRPDAVDAAWRAVDAEDAAHGRRDRRRSVSRFIGLAYVLTWAAITLAWLLASGGEPAPVAAVSGVLAIMLLLPGVLGFVLTRGSRRLARATRGTAVAFSVLPLLILVAIAGTCVAIIPPGPML